MCGRYAINGEELSEVGRNAVEQALRRMNGGSLRASGEIGPGDFAAVCARGRSGALGAYPMRWGYQAIDARPIINARSETAAQKPMFAQSMQLRRCAIPMTRYFEWEKRGRDRIRYEIAPEEGHVLLAGLYRYEGTTPVFVVLTRAPADNIAFIHDRMPVLLPEARLADWLDPSCPGETALTFADTRVRFAASI